MSGLQFEFVEVACLGLSRLKKCLEGRISNGPIVTVMLEFGLAISGVRCHGERLWLVGGLEE